MSFDRRQVMQAAALALPFPAAALPAAGAFRVIEHQWIAMADGVRLSARLWLPETPAPVPVVWEYIPYRKRDLYRGNDDAWGPQLAGQGIAFVRVDIRGSGESEGVMTDEYDVPELDDGMACIAWLARQPWSNGKVGMRGISWGGINALMLAARRPPALKAIMAFGATHSRFGNDAHYIGGALGHTNFQWGTVFKTVMAAPPDPAVVGDGWRAMWQTRLEATPAIMTRWLQHQTDDDYWQRGSIERDWGAIACPVYVVSGWQDTYVSPVGPMLARLTVPKKALIGPWGHTYPYLAAPEGLAWASEEVRWWQHWLLGRDTGLMREPMLRAFIPEATAREMLPAAIPGRWVSERTWPPRRPQTATLALGADGRLGGVARGAASIDGRKLVGLTKPEWIDRLPVDQAPDDLECLCFTGEPLATPVAIMGYPRVRLRLAADRAQAQVAVRLTEVHPDGRSWLVATGVLDLTHRHGHTGPEPLVPGAVFDVDVTLAMIAHRFRTGSRIRVAISESLWPLLWPSPEPVMLTLHHAGSALVLPLHAGDGEAMTIATVERPASPPAAVDQPKPDADGRVTIDHVTPPYRFAVAATGATIGGARRETSSIIPGRPETCHWQQETRLSFTRGDRDCALVASYDLTATPGAFTITESLTATEADKPVFTRSTTTDVPRRGR